ncbi:MAG: Uma2 family endonuclease [Cyanobacteriota bacterium]|nr:Uma2 family endonuclease [Cyanobacteriota bacterium]
MRSSPIILELPPSIQLSDDQFLELCEFNGNLRLERNLTTGEIWIRFPAGREADNRSLLLSAQLGSWIQKQGTGTGFGANTGFRIPGATHDPMSPSAAWIGRDRWNTLTREQHKKFPPLCPDFVIELRSPSDTVESLKQKMQEWLNLGVQLGWLIDRIGRNAYIYRADGTEDCLENPHTLSGESLLPGFVLELDNIW